MPSALRLALLCLALLPAVAGCARWADYGQANRSPLRAATASHDSTTLEILFVHMPLDEESASSELWASIDEQHLSTELRRELASNGFRAGLVGGQIPTELATLLNQSSELPTPGETPTAVNLESEALIQRRVLQLRNGRAGQIITSAVRDQFPLLMRKDGEVCGRTYSKAQGMLSLQSTSQPDGRVRVELTPELHYGEARQQFNGQDGIFRVEMGRPKEVFDKLRMESQLAPGQMLVVGCLANRPGSPGFQFFTEDSPQGLRQKLLVIRLAQTPADELFATAHP